MKTSVHSWKYLTEFLEEWALFQTKVEKIKTHVGCSIIFPKIGAFYEIVQLKYGRAVQVAGDSVNGACALNAS
jgi:ribosomal protein S19